MGIKTIKLKDAKEMRAKITSLNIIKLKTDQISKIIDLLPDNKEDINKICGINAAKLLQKPSSAETFT